MHQVWIKNSCISIAFNLKNSVDRCTHSGNLCRNVLRPQETWSGLCLAAASQSQTPHPTYWHLLLMLRVFPPSWTRGIFQVAQKLLLATYSEAEKYFGHFWGNARVCRLRLRCSGCSGCFDVRAEEVPTSSARRSLWQQNRKDRVHVRKTHQTSFSLWAKWETLDRMWDYSQLWIRFSCVMLFCSSYSRYMGHICWRGGGSVLTGVGSTPAEAMSALMWICLNFLPPSSLSSDFFTSEHDLFIMASEQRHLRFHDVGSRRPAND